MTPEQIEAALAAGIIDPAQARAMRAKSNAEKNDTPFENTALIGNENELRFIRSFSDVFVSLGIAMLSIGLMFMIGMIGGGVWYLLGAAALWAMCEYFGRTKRAHLPTLFLAIGYLVFVYSGLSDLVDIGAKPGVVPAIITVLAMALFYWRFRLPFSLALIAVSLIILVFALVGHAVPAGLLMLLSGLVLFISALWYDTHDTDRKTRYADNAFWLHFTAAPLIIHGFAILFLHPKVFKIGGIIPMVQLDKADAMSLLGIIGVLALIGLAINRRALLVSSLGYAAFAIAFIIKDTGMNTGNVLGLTLLLLGAAIVFLGVGWHGARRVLLKFLPHGGVFGKVFPPEPKKFRQVP